MWPARAVSGIKASRQSRRKWRRLTESILADVLQTIYNEKMQSRGRTWRTVRARKITVKQDNGWRHLYPLKNGSMVACRPTKLCPACKLAKRLENPTTRANNPSIRVSAARA